MKNPEPTNNNPYQTPIARVEDRTVLSASIKLGGMLLGVWIWLALNFLFFLLLFFVLIYVAIDTDYSSLYSIFDTRDAVICSIMVFELVATGYVLYLISTRKRQFRPIYLGYSIIIPISFLVGFMIGMIFDIDEFIYTITHNQGFHRLAFYCLLHGITGLTLSVYLLRSKRAKQTFVR